MIFVPDIIVLMYLHLVLHGCSYLALSHSLSLSLFSRKLNGVDTMNNHSFYVNLYQKRFCCHLKKNKWKMFLKCLLVYQKVQSIAEWTNVNVGKFRCPNMIGALFLLVTFHTRSVTASAAPNQAWNCTYSKFHLHYQVYCSVDSANIELSVLSLWLIYHMYFVYATFV